MLRIEVRTREKLHTMRGGIGASWHAMSRDAPLERERYDYPVRLVNPRGSGFGGNPPVTDEAAWKQIEAHAEWLGFNWMRVELSERMFRPERERFDWDNEEMQALYRILAWCQSNGADVFLQRMWGHVAWNAFPDVHPLLSAPLSLQDFAESCATLLKRLVRDLGFGCVKWFCITNEPPGGTWGYWWSTGSYPSVTITPALEATCRALDRADVDVGLSGPDWTDLPVLEEKNIDFDSFIYAYDLHSYQGMDPGRAAILKRWVDWAHARSKPFFLTEMGNMALGWGTDNPAPKSFSASLSNAETIVRGLRAGVDAFNRWSFTNRGDLDGQWQLIKTWDRDRKRYLEEIRPEPAAYYGYALMTRFLAKNATRMADRCDGDGADQVLTASMLSPLGHLTTWLVNLGEVDVPVEVAYADLPNSRILRRYQATESEVVRPGFTLQPLEEVGIEAGRSFLTTAPARSVTTLTTYDLAASDPGVVEEKA